MTNRFKFLASLLSLAAIATVSIAHGQQIFDPVARERTAPPALKAKLVQLRARITSQHFTFQVGATDPALRPLSKITGVVVPPDAVTVMTNHHAKVLPHLIEVLNPDIQKALQGLFGWKVPKASASASRVDMRTYGVIQPIRDQGQCGSCWDFSACCCLETSEAFLWGKSAPHASEQQILTCSGAGTSNGGWPFNVFPYQNSHGSTNYSNCPYQAADLTQDKAQFNALPSEYYAGAWAAVDPAHYTSICSTQLLKQAIVAHGCVSVCVYADDMFQHYTGGVFNEPGVNNGINHAIALVGWDDSMGAWILRNSWGTNWGNTCGTGTSSGYMYIKYGTNQVGSYACWCDSKR